MSSSSSQAGIWTPEVIATVIYRVVMTIVSITFLWMQYRQRPLPLDEEQHVVISLPPRQAKYPAVDTPEYTSGRNARPSLRNFASTQGEAVLHSALELDVGRNAQPQLRFIAVSRQTSYDAHIASPIPLPTTPPKSRSLPYSATPI